MSVRSSPSKSLTAISLALALIVIGAATASFLRKVESFEAVGFEAQAQAGHWLVTQAGPDAGDLESGDQILLINGEPASAVTELRQALRQRETSELLVVRNQEMVTVSFSRPELRIDLPYLALALIGLIYLLIGFYFKQEFISKIYLGRGIVNKCGCHCIHTHRKQTQAG